MAKIKATGSAGRKQYGGDTKHKAVLSINVGYRSLIDWVNSPRWTRSYTGPTGDSDVSYEPPGSFDELQGGGLSSRATMWSGSTQNAPSANPGSGSVKLPGDIGAAFDVANPKVPSMGGDADALAAAFGNHTPQWLYRMAEILKYNNSMSKSELKQIANTKGHAEYKHSTAIQDEMSRGLRDTREKIGKKGNKKDNPNFNPDGAHFVDRNAPSNNTAWERLPRFASGAKNRNYARTFSESVYSNMNTSIPKQFGLLKKTMMDRFDTGAANTAVKQAMGQIIVNEGDSAGLEGMYGAMGRSSSGFGGEEITKTGGATHQEKMVEIMGIGAAPKDKDVSVFGGWVTADPEGKNFGSRSIDIEFHKEVADSSEAIQGQRADLTTQSYQKSYQHGIGKTGATVDTSLEGIHKDQQVQIQRYNTVIQILKTIYGENISAGQLRQKIAYEQVPYGSTLTPSGRVKSGQAGDTVKSSKQLRQEIMYKFQGLVSSDIKRGVKTEWDESIAFVLHALGTHQASIPWANIMRIQLKDKQDNEYSGTLIINYTQDKDGYFQDFKKGDISIIEYSTEEWLYSLRLDSMEKMTFDQALDRANESFAVEAYEAGAVMGGLVRIQSGSVGHQTAHMRMPIPGELSQVMSAFTTNIIHRMANGLEEDMQTEMVAEATRFSKFARNQSNMGDIPSWMDAIADAFLTDTSGRGYSSMQPSPDFYNNTTLWFLWAAPYISTHYAKKGGAEQYRG